MIKDFKYRKKAILYFSFILVVLALMIAFLYRRDERKQQTELFYQKMETYADIIDRAIQVYKVAEPDSLYAESLGLSSEETVTALVPLLPSDLRVTIILENGTVVFDNEATAQEVDSHKDRSEIMQAREKGRGEAVRKSTTLDREFYYFAKRYPLEGSSLYYIRVALPYEIQYPAFFHSDNYFIYFIIILFALGLPALLLFTDRISKSLRMLRNFIVEANKTGDFEGFSFPDNEIGALSHEIKSTFLMLQKSKEQANEEREKLLSHFSHSGEGIAFFSSEGEFIYANSHFVRFLNKITDEPTYMLDSSVLQIPAFARARRITEPDSPNLIRYNIENGSSNIEVRVQLFTDGSFEIVLADVTQAEQNKRLKYEMTNSIAHELRTPVSSLRGYIETLLSNPDIPEEKKHYFLARSYAQLLRLSELISDVATLTKIEEAADLYPKANVSLKEVINEVEKDLEEPLKENEMTLKSAIDEKCMVFGNSTLLYTIFRNLVENSIKYAGKGSTIEIYEPIENEQYHYFAVSDNGVGIADSGKLEKLFDRFYRIDEGRSREDGGSGLGLSIVKNAIQLHGGKVQAKQRAGGGLEIFFSIAKE